MKSILPFILLLFIVNSCSDNAVDPPLKVSVTTDSHSSIYKTWAMINIKNGTSRKAYLTHNDSRIGYWKLEKAFKDKWIDVSTDTTFCRFFSPIQKIEIAPGEIYHDSVLIIKAGRYRMEFPFSWDENETDLEEISPEEFIVE